MNTKTAAKEFRKNQRNRDRNQKSKRNLKKINTKICNILSSASAESTDMNKKEKEFAKYMSILHKMCKPKCNIIHPNKAARLISRMSEKIKKS